jgi:hypothetical protein
VKAELEPEGVEYRGVRLISETEEEKQVLERIWQECGRPVMFVRNAKFDSTLVGVVFLRPNGNAELVVAPTSEVSHV